MFDVAPVARDEGWAVGQVSTEHVLLRRHGGTWQRATLPLPTSRGLFNIHLAASAPDNVWLFTGLFGAGGDNGGPSETPAARRWDGHQWITIPIDFTATDVAVLAPDDVWVLDSGHSHGRPVTRHWDGHRWTEYVLPHPAASLSASDPRNVWAVGHRDDPTGRTQSQPGAMRFDGTAWQALPTPEHRSATPKPREMAKLTEVVAVAGDNVWAFGDHDENPAATDPTGHHTIIVLHWDGSTWRKAPSAPDYTVDIHPFPDLAATGDGAGGFVLGGYQHGAPNGTLRVIGYPAPPPATSEAPSPTGQFRVNDLQLVPGTREVWAAGAMGFGASGVTPRGIIASCTLNG
ncbi:hypothetical protein [Plantactinospora sp. CA-290183]|uniref:hypothetical protein n=1 Tax=Plantactinospora sp. CA-290183 TaxID=3240006 RepID=UPI003D901A53